MKTGYRVIAEIRNIETPGAVVLANDVGLDVASAVFYSSVVLMSVVGKSGKLSCFELPVEPGIIPVHMQAEFDEGKLLKEIYDSRDIHGNVGVYVN